ncbi:unnamed protein product [Durusdinium trenchii]|uniref:Uncharacterized protein n=1 Tax=Durusdinium trenchii TaxID=1381693 RepID=A0ABP0RE85_9DINO
MRSAQYKSVRLDLKDHTPKTKKSNYMDLTHAAGFALATVVLLKTVFEDFACHFGLKCSSLCKVNVGTSMRSACSSEGFDGHASVKMSNMLLERTAALVLLCTALGGAWSVEQPGGSLMEYFPTWRKVIHHIFQCGGNTAVTIVHWWMGHYSARTAKRHYAYSNSCTVRKIDRGKLHRTQIPQENKPVTCEKYKDRSGKWRYKGTSQLKQTEEYPMPFARAMVDLVEEMKANAKGQPALPDEAVPSALITMSFFTWECDPFLLRLQFGIEIISQRCNAYDGVQEFWIVVKESAERTESTSYEEQHSKRSKADADPKCQFEKQFTGLGALDAREQKEKNTVLDDPKHDKYAQDRVWCIQTLEAEIKKIDEQFDLCQHVWAQGEMDSFRSEKCSKALAVELKVRTAKKFYSKKGHGGTVYDAEFDKIYHLLVSG